MESELVDTEILLCFGVDPLHSFVEPLGSGNINDTYLVSSREQKLVLQQINHQVFPDPVVVVENFNVVINHLKSQGEIARDLEYATPVMTIDNSLYHLDHKGGYWRGQSYLPGLEDIEVGGVSRQSWANSIGTILANFHHRLSDLSLQLLGDPLPGFHFLPGYLKQFDTVYAQHTGPLDEKMEWVVATINSFRDRGLVFEDAVSRGVLNRQPVHGDPKVDNFIYIENNLETRPQSFLAKGLLDLDTVGAGLIQYDLGDCLRSCCNSSGESTDIHNGSMTHPQFDLDLCQSILQGYFADSQKNLSREQASYIYDGIFSVTFELGLRFFTDHLNGNKYFKVEKNGDNLTKACNQLFLAIDVHNKQQDIKHLVFSCIE